MTTTHDRIRARRKAEREALHPVCESMRQAGHDPHPPHRADAYSNDFLIVCRNCGAQTHATLHADDDGGRIAEVTYDSATCTDCTTKRSIDHDPVHGEAGDLYARATKPVAVTVAIPNDQFGATDGRTATVLKSYWRNGEGWYRLRDGDEVFDSPDIFWQEATA